MQHLIKKLVIAAIVIALAYVGYMAIQRYYAGKQEDVKVQFLNFGTDDGYYNDGYHHGHHSSSYDRGYDDAMNNN